MPPLFEASFWNALWASLLACAMALAGIFTLVRYEAWGRRQIIYFMCFAAGVLISVAFLHLVPAATAANPHAMAYLLAGFFALHAVNRFLLGCVCDETIVVASHCDDNTHEHSKGHAHIAPDARLGLIPLVGIGFHSLIDGVIYSVTFQASFVTGLLSAVGLLLHKFPEGMITYLLLTHGGIAKQRALWLAATATAFTTPVGMLLSYPFLHRVSPATQGALLAVAAGALIYTGASHLLPKTEQFDKKYSLLALAGGIAVAVAIVLLPG